MLGLFRIPPLSNRRSLSRIGRQLLNMLRTLRIGRIDSTREDTIRSLDVPRASYFVASTGQPRVRRPRDVLKSVFGLTLLVWAVLTVENPPSWEQPLIELVEASSRWLQGLLGLGYALSLVYALIVVVSLVLGGKKRRAALRDLVIVALGSAGLVVFLSFLIYSAWPYVLPEIDLQNPTPRFPVMRVAVVTGILVVVAPYMTRPLRRFGGLAIVTTAIASVGLGYGTPLHTIGSVGVGLFTAGLLLVVVGSPRGYPDPERVAASLSALRAPSRGLEAAQYQTWGVARFIGTDEAGHPIDVKVHGRDAFDSQMVAKAWHTLWYRDTGRVVGYSRLQAVEHEALTTAMADRAGIRVPELVAVGSASEEISLIAFRGSGVALPDADPSDVTDNMLVETWAQVRLMHEQGMSHGSLRSSAVHLGPDWPVITDFAFGSLVADEGAQESDVIELVFSLGALVGEERAVRSALDGLGRDRLLAALPYLQLPAISPISRRLTEKPKKLIAALTSKVVELTGTDIPEPVKLRRVTLRSLAFAVLLFLIAWALIPALLNVDYAEIWAILDSADWGLIVAALLVGQSQFFPQATATMFAVPIKLPFWPLLTLQTASQFISLAIPSSAGRVAMNAAFLQKFGVSVTSAVAQGAIDGISGFLVQAVILILAFLTGDVDLDIEPANVSWLLVLGIIALIVVGVVVAILRIEALRERVVPVVSQAWGALMVVLRKPSRAFGLLGSNFVYWNVLGGTLWLITLAVGADLSYASALFVAAGTSLLAGFMPVPGGVGVAEATMIALLAVFGVDDSTALAVTSVYRVITFYLPAIEGFFGTRWLERNDYI